MPSMRTQFGKVIRDSDVCVLCGERPATSKEHIPPKSIFLESPKEYLSVPACDKCNNSTKLEDEYLRQVMAGAGWTEEALKVWRQKVKPKFLDHTGTRIGLRNSLARGSIAVPNVGRVNVDILKADAARIQTSVRKMVWGLYWFHTGRIRPPGETFEVFMLNVAQVTPYLRDSENARTIAQTGVGVYRDALVCRSFFYRAGITPENSLWYFVFYRQNVLIAYTGTEAVAPPAAESSEMQPAATSYRPRFPPGSW
jgi:hypothetical protein